MGLCWKWNTCQQKLKESTNACLITVYQDHIAYRLYIWVWTFHYILYSHCIFRYGNFTIYFTVTVYLGMEISLYTFSYNHCKFGQWRFHCLILQSVSIWVRGFHYTLYSHCIFGYRDFTIYTLHAQYICMGWGDWGTVNQKSSFSIPYATKLLDSSFLLFTCY